MKEKKEIIQPTPEIKEKKEIKPVKEKAEVKPNELPR